jgi:hypothetical protein
MAGQGSKARALAKEITDGLISLRPPAEGFATCLVSTSGTVLDDGDDVTSPGASTALKPFIAVITSTFRTATTFAAPFSALYWHIGDTAIRLARAMPPRRSGSNRAGIPAIRMGPAI